jgi:ribosomal protein S18 acetylase RimI-like enzyme
MQITIHLMSENDIDEIISFQENKSYDKKILLGSIANNFHLCLIAKNSKSQIVGFCTMLFLTRDEKKTKDGISIEEGYLDLFTIETHEEFRNLGVGSMMIRFIVNFAMANTLKNIFLEVRENNYPAIKMYEKFGFKPQRVRRNYYIQDKKLFDAIEYCLTLF